MAIQGNASSSARVAGLSERDIIEVFQVGERCPLKRAEEYSLSDEVGNLRTVLVLEGRVRLVIPREDELPELLELEAGEWAGASPQLAFEPQSLSAVEPSVVVVLAPQALQTVDSRLQSEIQQRLAATALRSARASSGGSGPLAARLDLLSLHVRRSADRKWQSCVDSGLIREILEEFGQLPMYASDLAVRLREGRLSARESSEMARRDPTLVAAILKAVNTLHPRLRGRVADLQQAVTLLGLHQVHQLIVEHGLRQTMPDSEEFQRLRDRALIISLICFELGKLKSDEHASALSALGLLHNLGESIQLLLIRRNPNLKPLIEQLDQGRLGALLLRQWNLPESIWRAIHFQDYPYFAPSPAVHAECRREVAFLFLARLCWEALAGDEEDVFTGPFFDDYRDLTELDFLSLSELAEERVLPALISTDHNLPDSTQQFLQDATRRLRKRFELGN